MREVNILSALWNSKRASLLAILCCAVLLMPLRLFGQADQGSIAGIVQDSSGAAIGRANVTLTDTDTGLVLKTKTGSSGIYTFSPIKIGNYSISAVAPGFSVTDQQHIHVDAQSKLNVPLTLQLGSVSQTITVSSPPPLLQTESGSVGQ
ncbi:MAG TPA: carboxypeptidase-like regulatory domain-containing protein, partial [Acidobacteriaceae bacterium]